MTQLNEVYKCEICGNIVGILHTGAGELVCCGQAMKLMTENTVDALLEKHVPVIEKSESGVIVKIGAEEHPMTEAHYIEWIEVIADGKACRKMLKAGERPEAVFKVSGTDIKARAYCNLHGLWSA